MPFDWGFLEWHWRVNDLAQRVSWARRNAPRDVFTFIAVFGVRPVASLITFSLQPIDRLARLLGRLSIIFVGWGLILFFFITVAWLPFLGLLAGSSWLWLRFPITRPLLLLPGSILSLTLTAFLMIVPDPEKKPNYVDIAKHWPLTWYIWRPPEQYYIDEGISDANNPYVWERAFGDTKRKDPLESEEPTKYDPL